MTKMQQQVRHPRSTLSTQCHIIDYSVHHSLHNASPQYLPSLLHSYTPSRQLRSASLNLLSQPRINIALACHGFRHAGLFLCNSLPNHLRTTDSHTVFKSNLKLTFSLVQAFLASNNSIHALLIQHNYVDFASAVSERFSVLLVQPSLREEQHWMDSDMVEDILFVHSNA